MLKPGDIVEIDGQLAVVVGTAGQDSVPEDHVAVWFGEPKAVRGQAGGHTPEVWTIPEEYFTKVKKSQIMH
jgi:hypothetical protein